MYTVERYALILSPKKELTDWVNYIFPGDNQLVAAPKPGEHDRSDVYLLPNFDSPEDALAWLKGNYVYFFEIELENWCTNEEQWPKKRSWEVFDKWMNFSIQSCVYDVMEEKIEKEEM